MAQVRTWVGLDVHAAKVVAAIADASSGELAVQRMGGATEQVAGFCTGLPAPVRVAYEAGPTGFGLARALAVRGIECTVAAPGKIERPAQDRVKTDRRDAERLVRLLMIGGLHPVRVPTPAEEAMRDLVRAREDVRGDLMRARHRVAKLLLRHDLRFEGNNWTQRHLDWLGRVELPEPVAQAVLLDGIGSIDALLVRRESLESQMASLVEGSPWEQSVAHLRCLRGIDTLSALGLCAEVGDFERFARPAQLMSYLGLVPSENSSGEKRRQGSITKSGSRHARRLLVEAAWHYRRSPRKGRELRRRQEGQPQAVCAISWKAQQRLHRSWVRLDSERGKRRTLCAVAVARELTGFCWAVATAD
ncbi:MAG: IS110 family RNA-guided transposase [Solirubrobacteraceae bacterium]